MEAVNFLLLPIPRHVGTSHRCFVTQKNLVKDSVFNQSINQSVKQSIVKEAYVALVPTNLHIAVFQGWCYLTDSREA